MTKLTAESKETVADQKPLVTVVVPNYNDAAIIEHFFKALKATIDHHDKYRYEIIYVDDGSTDGSQKILAKLAADDSRITVIELIRNFGQQRALFAGLTWAKGDFVVTIDGDNQYEPDAIVELVEALESGFEMASGVRVLRKDKIFTIVTSRIGQWLIKSIIGIDIKDFGAVKGFNRELVDQVILNRHYFSDVYGAALMLRPALVEIPVRHKPRVAGKSHWTLFDRAKAYIDLYINHGDEHFGLFFKGGLLLSFLGVLFFVLVMGVKLTIGHPFTFALIAALSYLIWFTGLITAGWAMLMSFLIRVYKQNLQMDPFIVRQTHGHRGDKGTTESVLETPEYKQIVS